MNAPSDRLAHKALLGLEKIGLAIVAIATVIAIGEEILAMVGRGTVALADLLLLFIYLEVLAMVAMYLESGQLPVRLPLYIGIVALARYLILDMKSMDNLRILAIAAAALLLAVAVLVIRYGHAQFPYGREGEAIQPGKDAGAENPE